MGYRALATNDLYDMYRRWHAGQGISGISARSGIDRKTIRKYINRILAAGLSREAPLAARQRFFAEVGDLLPSLQRVRSIRGVLEPYTQELRDLINDPAEPVKPKTAFLIVSRKYELAVSYETFKLFAREKQLTRRAHRTPLRIEVDPGLETQMDYGRVGRLLDPDTGRQRIVWAFCGLLAHCRLPFIQFVYTQDGPSFAGSIIDMGQFYEGFTQALRMDNLKAAVIKPDLWDPQINRSLAEVGEYYGFFIDPCRVARATDKGKIERLVPVARELFRRLKHTDPQASLSELNIQALQWCRCEYGLNKHGTTGQRPWQVYQQVEKATLKSLPAERFEVARWKSAKVHADRFVALNGKYYALPAGYAGTTVWLRACGKILRIFRGERLIREYLITGKLRSWRPEDFPEGPRQMMDGSYPRFLLQEAQRYGPTAVRYLEFLLHPHAYLNARRARGVLSVMAQYASMSFFSSVCQAALDRHVRSPQSFKVLCEDERRQLHLQFPLALSEVGQAMTRPISYFFSQGGLDGDTTSSGTASEEATHARDALDAGAAAL